MAQKSGVTIKDIYWTLGHLDIVAICEAPEDETITAGMLSFASGGNIEPRPFGRSRGAKWTRSSTR
jgi:uncharacterized protein with GYD domain